MHTDTTLEILSQVTTSLGNSLREFEGKTCTMFQTRELERERTARQRRQERNTANNGTRPESATLNYNTRKPKYMNLNTYKYHALGDYVSTIRRFGTTDSYSTQPVSLQLTCAFCLLLMDIRVNLSTEHQRHVLSEPVADRYHCSCRRLNNKNATFT